MAAQLSTLSLPDFTRLGDFIWDEALESVPAVARNSGLFKVSNWPAGTGDTREFNEIDGQEYASIKDEGDQATQAIVQQGYTKIMTLTRIGTDIPITWEMRRRNKADDVVTRLTNVASQQKGRMELDLSHRISFATATSYTNREGRAVDISVGDGFALAYTAHTVRGSSSTYRNLLAGNPTFSRGSLEAMEKMTVENTINQFGEKMACSYDTIFSTDDPNTRNLIAEQLQATAAISAPNEGVPNVYRAKYRHVVLPLIATDANGNVDSDKSKYWGIASSRKTSARLSVEQEPTLTAPSMGSNAEDFSTEDWTYKGRASYGIVVLNGSWFAMSKGNGDA